MKLEIFEEQKAEKTDEPVRLRLRKTMSGGIDLVAVDKKGVRLEQGTLLFIDKRGVMLCTSIDKNLGLSLDNAQRLKIVGS